MHADRIISNWPDFERALLKVGYDAGILILQSPPHVPNVQISKEFLEDIWIKTKEI